MKQPHGRVLSVKELDSMRQSQTGEFHMYHSKQPRTQLSTGAPRIEESASKSTTNSRKRKHRQVNITGQIRDQKHKKSTRIQEANISTALITSNHSEIPRAMEKISETNHLMAQQWIAQQRVLQALLLQQEQSNKN